MTMARGATVRLRLYAWRYAACCGRPARSAARGPAAYPRLAGVLAAPDMTLDPAAFMGERESIVEHAHNELFEVLTEIGLVGGVTFVAGLLATLFAGSALLRNCAGS